MLKAFAIAFAKEWDKRTALSPSKRAKIVFAPNPVRERDGWYKSFRVAGGIHMRKPIEWINPSVWIDGTQIKLTTNRGKTTFVELSNAVLQYIRWNGNDNLFGSIDVSGWKLIDDGTMFVYLDWLEEQGINVDSLRQLERVEHDAMATA